MMPPAAYPLVSLLQRANVRTGSKPAPNLKLALCVLKAKELALGQENWFQSSISSLLVYNKEPAKNGLHLGLGVGLLKQVRHNKTVVKHQDI